MGAVDEITSAVIRGGPDFVKPPDQWDWIVQYATDHDHFDTAYVYGMRQLVDDPAKVNQIADVLRRRDYRFISWRRYKHDGHAYKVRWPLYRKDGRPRLFREVTPPKPQEKSDG